MSMYIFRYEVVSPPAKDMDMLLPELPMVDMLLLAMGTDMLFSAMDMDVLLPELPMVDMLLLATDMDMLLPELSMVDMLLPATDTDMF